VEKFRSSIPEKSLELAENTEHFGSERHDIGGHLQRTLRSPIEAKIGGDLGFSAKYIEPPIDSRAFRICLWLQAAIFAEAAGRQQQCPETRFGNG
jgi:hypothetical protein